MSEQVWKEQAIQLMALLDQEKRKAAEMSDKPVCHLVWRQGRRAADDVEDYYEVARPGDKCVDGSDPFPVYLRPAPEGWQLAPKEPTGAMISAAKSTTSAALTASHATEIYVAMLAASTLSTD